MYHFDQKTILNRATASQHGEVTNRRRAFDLQINAFVASQQITENQAARIPQDAYRDIDAQTKRLMVGDEGAVLLNLLAPVTRAIPIGKIVAEYRKAGDSGNANVSISGQTAKKLDKTVYDYEGGLVLIHDDSFGREWREMEAQRTEGFDGLIDDQANSVRTVRRSIIEHFANGVANVKFKGSTALGIKDNGIAFDLGTSGQNVDLTSAATTFANIQKVFIAALKTIQGPSNNAEGLVDFVVSADIWFNLMRNDGLGTQAENFYAMLMKLPGIKSIQYTASATILTGNAFFAMVVNEQYIQPIVGMAVNTVPVTRQTPWDNYNFVTWGAAGILVKQDAAGRKGVMYARNIT